MSQGISQRTKVGADSSEVLRARSGFKSHQVGLRREAFRVLALSALPDDAAFAAGESKLGEVPTARHEECEIQQHEASDVPSALSDLLRDKPACAPQRPSHFRNWVMSKNLL